jgi:HSP20 family protein
MERMFDRLVTEPFEHVWSRRNGNQWMPMLDITDNEKEVVIRAEIPGVAVKDVDISVSGNILTICGKKEESTQEGDMNFFVCERRFGEFRRTIELPEGVDPEKVFAEQDNGVLTVRIARLPTATPKHIPVRARKNSN